jgi:fructan beta-fructosidase
MTIPRDLGLVKDGDQYSLVSNPVPELKAIFEKTLTLKNVSATPYDLSNKLGHLSGPVRLKISSEQLSSFTLTLSNEAGQKLLIGYDKDSNQYFIDRTESGKVDFEKGFGSRKTAPRFSSNKRTDITLIIDDASVELFADGGRSVMTAIFFPDSRFTNWLIKSPQGFKINTVTFERLKSIW